MGAHHAAVMKARESAGDGIRRSFAYSTGLDRDAFETWRSQTSLHDSRSWRVAGPSM